MENRLSHEEVVEESAQVVQSGRLALLTSVDPSLLSSLLGDIAVWLMESGDDVMRIDALESHSAADIISALCRYLEVSGQDLMTGLRMRGEAGNPVCIVIDNVECLEGKALQVVRTLLEGTSGGVGLLLGGEPDSQLYLEDAEIAQPFFVDIDTQVILPELHDVEDGDDALEGVLSMLPWRHFLAAAGLGLLAWLFWPTGPSEPDVRSLNLPAKSENLAGTVIDSSVESSVDAVAASQDEGFAERPASTAVDEPKVFVSQYKASDLKEPEDTAPEAATESQEMTADVKSVTTVEKSEPAPVAEAPTPKPVVKSAPPKKSVAAVQEPSLTGLAADLGYHQEEWLLTRPASQWVLQVALASSEDGARSLLDQIGRSASAYYRTSRSGRLVYIVLAGPWPTRDAAVAGKAALPQALQALGPFPRGLSAVQKEIGITP